MQVNSSYGTIGRLLAGALTTRDRMDGLVRQASTGLRAESFSGLAPQARMSIDLRVEVARRDTYARAIETAEARITVTQSTLGRIGELTSDMAKRALSLITLGDTAVDVVAQEARGALQEIASLLNVRAGDAYVFGGSDSANPPVPNASAIVQTGFFTQIQAATQLLGVPWDHDANPLTPDVPRSAAQVMADTLAIAASDVPGTTPFSGFLSTVTPGGGLGEPRTSLLAEDGTRIVYGLRANQNGVAQSAADPPTTGSFMRDLMRGLAMLGSLTEAQAAEPEFVELMQRIAGSLQSAGRTLEDERAAMGVAEQRLARTKQAHADLQVVLKTQISKVEDVDIAEVTARLQLLQVQLEMSYRLIGGLRDMNLARYV
jgi:flagellin-like hook-associated protein FlgL